MPCTPSGSLARPPYDFLRVDAHGHPHTCTRCGEALVVEMVGHTDALWVTADGRAYDDRGEPRNDPALGVPHPLMPWNRSVLHLAAPCPDPQAPLLPGVEACPECCGLPMMLRDDGWLCRKHDTRFPFAAA